MAFYVGHLGFEPAYRFAWMPGASPVADEGMGLKGSGCRIEILRKDDFYMELFEFEAPSPQPIVPGRGVHEHGYTHLCLYSDDLEADYSRLREAGVVFHSQPIDRGIHKFLYLLDPDGNTIELLEITAEEHPFGRRQ